MERSRRGYSFTGLVHCLTDQFSCVVAGCAWLCMVTVSLLAGSEPAVRPVFHFGMDIEDATQTSGRTAEQHPWLEYSVWQDQEWVRIYSRTTSAVATEEAVPDLPDNSFREWKRVTDPIGGTGEHSQAWTIRDWQHHALSPSPLIKPRINHLLTCRIRTSSESRRCSPMPPLFLTVIARLLCNFLRLLPRLSLRLAGLSVQTMLEQDVQTFITWTHGAQPTWLQFHGPGTLLDRPVFLCSCWLCMVVRGDCLFASWIGTRGTPCLSLRHGHRGCNSDVGPNR